MSAAKVEQAIDYWVDRYDPYAVRAHWSSRARGRHVDVEPVLDGSGLSTVEAVLFDHDAAALDKRLDAMARAVCDGDPRTLDQRRADALGALAHGGPIDWPAQCGGTRLCRCGCTHPSAVVINVIAEEKSLSDDTVGAAGWCQYPDHTDHAAAGDDDGRGGGVPGPDRAGAPPTRR